MQATKLTHGTLQLRLYLQTQITDVPVTKPKPFHLTDRSLKNHLPTISILIINTPRIHSFWLHFSASSNDII